MALPARTVESYRVENAEVLVKPDPKVSRRLQAICLLIILSSIFLGGNDSLFRSIYSAIVIISAAGLAILHWKRVNSLVIEVIHKGGGIILPLALTTIVGLFQTTPLPGSLVDLLSPNMFEKYNWASAESYFLSADARLTSGVISELFAVLIIFATILLLPEQSKTLWKFFPDKRSRARAGSTREFVATHAVIDENAERITKAVIASSVICAGIALYHWAAGLRLYLGYFGEERLPDVLKRAHFPFVNPDHFGALMAIGALLSLSRLLFRYQLLRLSYEYAYRQDKKKGDYQRWSLLLPYVYPALFLIVSLFLSASRAAISLFLLSSALLVLVNRQALASALPARRKGSIFTTVLGMLAFLCAIFFFLGEKGRVLVSERVEYGLTAGYDELRAELARLTGRIIVDYPFFGVGLGAYEAVSSSYATPKLMGWKIDYAHNEPLQIVAESGLFGVLSLTVGFISLLALFFRSRKKIKPGPQMVLHYGIFLAVLVPLLHSLVDFHLRMPGVAVPFFAVLAVFYKNARRSGFAPS